MIRSSYRLHGDLVERPALDGWCDDALPALATPSSRDRGSILKARRAAARDEPARAA
ncbi:MAG: hypothetical protein IPJ17_02125 [Holophagales bacterium]|nr:MAG: hypothetical protein IPJ17_02125 [Holophagales bacterium]